MIAAKCLNQNETQHSQTLFSAFIAAYRHLQLPEKTMIDRQKTHRRSRSASHNHAIGISMFLCVLLISSPLCARECLIWDDQPASSWDVAYPVGNGRLGAMPFGTFPEEQVLINEETIWSRRETFGMPKDSFLHLEKVRELERAGDYSGADAYFEKHLQNGQDPCGYQVLGSLRLKISGHIASEAEPSRA